MEEERERYREKEGERKIERELFLKKKLMYLCGNKNRLLTLEVKI